DGEQTARPYRLTDVDGVRARAGVDRHLVYIRGEVLHADGLAEVAEIERDVLEAEVVDRLQGGVGRIRVEPEALYRVVRDLRALELAHDEVARDVEADVGEGEQLYRVEVALGARGCALVALHHLDPAHGAVHRGAVDGL